MKRTRTAVLVLTLLAPAASFPSEQVETRIEVAPGETLRVVESGGGDPVVLIPGLLSSAFGFRNLIGPLADAGHRVVVVEPLGFGGSSRPPGADYSLTAQSERIAVALDVLGVRGAVVVGHAVAASMALRLACRHPSRVRAIVAVDGGPAETAATPGVRRAMRFAFLIRWFGGAERIRRAVRATLRERSVDSAWVTDDIVDGYLRPSGGDMEGTLAALRAMAGAREPEPLAPRLGDVRCPVRLVIGDMRAMRGISDAEIELMARGLASFEIESVETAGHFVYEEDPRAVLAAIGRSAAASPPTGAVASGGR
jgi:pimeloyl-ACP methyl ester carboxylesterase